MTTRDHNETMSRVGIADLKAHLSEHLRKVRAGRTITVVDRDTPVASIVPYEKDGGGALEVRAATRKPRDLRLPAAPAKRTDSVGMLLKDRAAR
jgi:prevent-host-death family protein